jgi:prepilin-type N-terminal cleavage/methylation domain-containing protein
MVKYTKGFTLVEMIVSLAIFAVVAVIAIGALLKVIDANKKAQSIQSSVTNLNFALESMSRDLRTGTSIQCTNSFNSPASFSSTSVVPCSISQNPFIAFYSTRTNPTDSPGSCTHNLITAYTFAGISPNIKLQKAEQASCTVGGYAFTDLISPTDMNITGYELGVIGATPSYPLTFIRITGYAGTKTKDQTYVDLETAVSARSQQ